MDHRRFAAASIAALSLVLLAGCFGDDKEKPLERLTPAERTAETNADRDATEVAEKAAAVDPCALLAASKATGDAVPEASGPHSCWMSDGSVRADVHTLLDTTERFRMARIEVAGTAAYRADTGGSCEIHLPTSQTHAISLSGPQSCTTTTAYAEAVASVLSDEPRTVTRPVGLGRVSACDLIEAAGLQPFDDTTVSNYSVLDHCNVDALPIDLRLEYDDDVVQDYQIAHRVAGTTVRTQRNGDRCHLHWPLAPADIAAREGEVLSTWVTTRTCAQGLRFARRLIPAARTVASPDREPTDLLYAWDQPDTAAVGACVDVALLTDLECLPAEEADVPDDRRDLIMEAEADPDVLCAAATPVVREHYGEEFTPVTTLASPHLLINTGAGERDDSTQCVFGSPEHTLEVSIVLSTAPADLATDDEVAGHPAYIASPDTGPSLATASYVVARDQPDEPGFLAVGLKAWPERGTGLYRLHGKTVQPDLTRIKAAGAFVTDLTEALL